MQSNEKDLSHYSIIIVTGLLMSILEYTYTLLFSLFLNSIVHSIQATLSETTLYYTIVSFTIALLLPPIGKYLNKINLKLIVFVSVIQGSICMILLTIVQNIWQLYLLAIFIGICSSTCGTVVQGMVINNWFEKNRNYAFTASSFVSTIYLLIMTPALTFLINSFGWKQTLYFLFFLTLVIGLPCALIIRAHPKGKIVEIKENRNSSRNKNIMFSSKFLMVLVFFIAISFASNTSQLFPTYTADVGFGEITGGIMETIMTGIDILITPLFAYTTNRFRDAPVLKIWSFFGLLTFINLLIATQFRLITFTYLAAIGADILTDLYGPGEQIFARDIFGKKFNQGYTLINSITYIISAFSLPVLSFIYDTTRNWNYVFLLGLVLMGIIILILDTAYKKFAE